MFNIWVYMQVHITQGDHEGRSVIVSWVTPLESHPNVVTFWEADDGHGHNHDDDLDNTHKHPHHHHHHKHETRSITTSYKYYNYTSGYIHHATLEKLKVNLNLSSKINVGHILPHFPLCFYSYFTLLHLRYHFYVTLVQELSQYTYKS